MSKMLQMEDCEKILKRSINHPTEILSYEITKFSDEVMGFLGEHFRVTIKFTKNGTKEVKEATYFLKTVPVADKSYAKFLDESGIFKKEILVYENILSDLLKIAEFAPKCYFTKADCIVLEDLSLRGFDIVKKQTFLTVDMTVSMLKTMAKYHAACIIYEETEKVKLDEKFDAELQETCFSFVEGKPRQRWCVNVIKCLSDLIHLLPNVKNPDKISSKLHNFVFEQLPNMIKPSKQFRNVLNHEDLWFNNIMFDAQLNCLFIDFQLARYAPPAFDFLESLYLNTEKSVLDRKFEEFKNVYYDSLQYELKIYGIDSGETLLSKSEFDRSLNHYKLAVLIEAAMYGTVIYIPPEISKRIVSDIKKFDEFSFVNRSKYLVKLFKGNKDFRDRLNHVLLPLVDALVIYNE